MNNEKAPSDVLEIQGLDGYYGDRQVLFDIRFSIPRHYVTVIMGPSGCGKSTLVRHLIGLNPNPVDRVFLEGSDLGRFTGRDMAAYRRRMGVLFQSGALFNSLTVAQNIAVPLKVHTRLADETIRIIAKIKLHQVGLTGYGDYMPSQLSGGMQKRAGLARSLAMDPEILFVDEPSSGLDPITAAGLDDLILELREALGMTIVVVTHELESAFRIGDQIVVMDRGRVLALGTPEEIQQTQAPRVRQFLGRQAEHHQRDTQRYLSSLLK
jgi:phospholipid/cholesterol/gamma-HCH transport system ATP-binding protein